MSEVEQPKERKSSWRFWKADKVEKCVDEVEKKFEDVPKNQMESEDVPKIEMESEDVPKIEDEEDREVFKDNMEEVSTDQNNEEQNKETINIDQENKLDTRLGGSQLRAQHGKLYDGSLQWITKPEAGEGVEDSSTIKIQQKTETVSEQVDQEQVDEKDEKDAPIEILNEIVDGILDGKYNISSRGKKERQDQEETKEDCSLNLEKDPEDIAECAQCETQQVHECRGEQDKEKEQELVKEKEAQVEQEKVVVDQEAMEELMARIMEKMNLEEKLKWSQAENNALKKDLVRLVEETRPMEENNPLKQDIVKLVTQPKEHKDVVKNDETEGKSPEVEEEISDNEVKLREVEAKLLEAKSQEEKAVSKAERLTKYLDFVKLWVEVKDGEDAAAKRREANLMWRSRIEVGDTVSLPDYLEQVCMLRAAHSQKRFGDSQPQDETTGAEFICYGAQESVLVAGSWNSWEPSPLTLQLDGEEWSALFNLPPGRYEYKYVVDGEWLVDPSKEVITDETGNQNNVVVVENRLGKVLREISEERVRISLSLSLPWRTPSGLGLCPLALPPRPLQEEPLEVSAPRVRGTGRSPQLYRSVSRAA